jgi:hypothetical protein
MMDYEATMIINVHQPVHIGYYPNKEEAAEAIINHAKNNLSRKATTFYSKQENQKSNYQN